MQLVRTYSEATSADFNTKELEIASAIAVFDILVERREMTDEIKKSL